MDYKLININKSSILGLFDLRKLNIENKREKETEGAKFLLTKLVGEKVELAYYETGKPYLKGRNEEISISHSHNMLAIIVDSEKPTGVDVELIREKVLNITHKFLSNNELVGIINQPIEKVLVYWAAKETLYKIYSKKNVDFKEHLFVHNFEYNELGGEINSSICLDNFELDVRLKYLKINEYILVYPV